MTALKQCLRLSESDSTMVVKAAVDEVRSTVTLGKDHKINYRADAGKEAKEGQKLCEALVQQLGALWDESYSLHYMMEQWQTVCKEADKDNSGTISEDEAVAIWEKLLDTFRRYIGDQLERLGAATRASTRSALEV